MKKSLSLLTAVAAFAIGFTLCSCGGGSSMANGGGKLNIEDMVRGKIKIQTIPNASPFAFIYANGADRADVTTIPAGSNYEDATTVVFPGKYEVGRYPHRMTYIYTRESATTFKLTFSVEDTITVDTEAFIRSLGFGTSIQPDEGETVTFASTNIDSLSGISIEMTFDEETQTCTVDSELFIETTDEETKLPKFTKVKYREESFMYRVIMR